MKGRSTQSDSCDQLLGSSHRLPVVPTGRIRQDHCIVTKPLTSALDILQGDSWRLSALEAPHVADIYFESSDSSCQFNYSWMKVDSVDFYVDVVALNLSFLQGIRRNSKYWANKYCRQLIRETLI